MRYDPDDPRDFPHRKKEKPVILYRRIERSSNPRLCCAHNWVLVKQVKEDEEIISLQRCPRCLAQAAFKPLVEVGVSGLIEYDRTGELFARYGIDKIPVA